MIRELEQIAGRKDVKTLHDIFTNPVLIEDCLIDSVKYSNRNAMVGGYIKKSVDMSRDGYLNDTYVYYWLCLENIRKVEIMETYVIQSFKIETKGSCVLLEAGNGLIIVADKVRLDSITPTWCKDLNSNII